VSAFGQMVAVSNPPVCDLSEGIYPPCVKLRFGGPGDAYFCFLLEGSISEGSDTYPSGKVIFFPSGTTHTVEIVHQCRCFIVRVGSALLNRLNTNPFQSHEAKSLATWEATWLARRLYAEFLRRAPAGELRIEAIILQLLALAARSGREKHGGRESAWLRRVREVIDGQYLRDYRLTELASVAGVHRVHLVREFRKHYGTTIGDYMRKLRLDYAYQLLGQTNLPLREIAAECRFADQSHFTKQFKKFSGLTPAEYRNLFQASRIESRPSIHHKQFREDLHIGIGERSFVGADRDAQDSGHANTIVGSHFLPQAAL
jgi:AraC family transcriptional regulator